jgi:hypothetical protein
MAGMPRQGGAIPISRFSLYKGRKKLRKRCTDLSTKSLSPLFCVPESVSVVVYSLAAIVSSEFQVNTRLRVLAGAAADTTTGGGVFGRHPANDRDGPSFPASFPAFIIASAPRPPAVWSRLNMPEYRRGSGTRDRGSSRPACLDPLQPIHRAPRREASEGMQRPQALTGREGRKNGTRKG